MVEAAPHARGAAVLLDEILAHGRVSLDTWEPDYGRLAEAQVKWEAAHGRPLTGDSQ
jgi:tRNA threonylcarbamoyladenosine biosynthesis protein TsaB